ncbi:MAG: hypothetical protein ACK55Z_28890, partial [bacterium]
SSLRVCSAWFAQTSITNGCSTMGKLMRMLSIRISSLRVCSACASETKCGIALSKIKIVS